MGAFNIGCFKKTIIPPSSNPLDTDISVLIKRPIKVYFDGMTKKTRERGARGEGARGKRARGRQGLLV